jgi:transcriptional regulator with XRE-family HTH domain
MWTTRQLNARALKTRAELVGLSGQSSGGHLAMLVAMRPWDARYAAIPLPAGSGINRTYLSGVERSERNVSIDNIARIGKGLRVDPWKLLKDD